MNLLTAITIITAAGAYLTYDNRRRHHRARAMYRHPTSVHVRIIGVRPELYDQDTEPEASQ